MTRVAVHRSVSKTADKSVPVREAATQVLLAVLDRGESLSAALPAMLGQVDHRNRRLLQALCYGVLRWLPLLRSRLSGLLSKPLRKRDLDVELVLLLGLYQLDHTAVPSHAAVSESVNAVRRLGKPWARGLVNATLRRATGEPPAPIEQEQHAHAHPDWMVRRVKADWPGHWRDILAANNQQGPMTLRVNQRWGTRTDYLAMLTQHGIGAEATTLSPTGIRLERPVDVLELPAFDSGAVSVQDEASQLAAPLLDASTGRYVLDACAAPGGKLAHLLELTNNELDLVAVEIDTRRAAKIEQNLHRLGLTARVCRSDVAQPDDWWDGKTFDRILLDAPCSATGVIRRHPDIKWLRREHDLLELCALQAELLCKLWALLASGGVLLYATCSILRCENQHQIERFVQTHCDARGRELPAHWGIASQPGRQILPGELQMDGFFYALLEKH